jgi:tRNA modification GTPase
MIFRDTIYALSSGAGRAGIAIIRVSGPQARAAILKMSARLPPARRANYVSLRDPDTGELYDRGLVLWFPGPGSATGEDVAEFHVHGSRAVVDGLMGCLAGLEACRPAMPGEFLRRAFGAGKLDLVEVEGLADLLAAETAAQRRLVQRQVSGLASRTFEDWRARLLRILALVEASVDFSDERDVLVLATDKIADQAVTLVKEMEIELARGRRTPVVRLGAKVVLAGVPNTGKSSLLNALARREAAIVSAKPGTTRDVIEVPLDIDGLPVTLTDTAGLRSNVVDEIEGMGIGRTEQEIVNADVVVWVHSQDIPGSADATEARSADLIVQNKCDVDDSGLRLYRNDAALPKHLAISAKTGQGIGDLLTAIGEILRARYGQGEAALITRERQIRAVEETIRFLNEAIRTQDGPPEIIAENLRRAGTALARLTGRIDVEDLLSVIFAEFCIGK